MQKEAVTKEILIEEYKFFQKAYELQFSHFMGVFYFWVAVMTVPTGAGVMGLRNESVKFGLLYLFLGLMGTLLTAKMFDIRRSQVGYLQRVNEIRFALWKEGGIRSKTGIHPYGYEVKADSKEGTEYEERDLLLTAREDFGWYMALVMSLFNGVVFGIGVWNITKCLPDCGRLLLSFFAGACICGRLLFSVFAGVFIFWLGVKLFKRILSKPRDIDEPAQEKAPGA